MLLVPPLFNIELTPHSQVELIIVALAPRCLRLDLVTALCLLSLVLNDDVNTIKTLQLRKMSKHRYLKTNRHKFVSAHAQSMPSLSQHK